jgi:ribosomal protein S18 acetylase RimI-like enzyme
MPVVYRPARAQDLERADAVVVSTINHLTEGHGFGPMASPHPPQFQLFSLKDDPSGLWVAEDDDEIIGFAWSWACGDLWFLAQLFCVPGRQGGGIGDELLTRTLDHARKSNAANRALITFAFNAVSQGLYIRHGFFPRFPIYSFGADRNFLKGRLHAPLLRCVPIEDTASHLDALAEIDARALSVSREKHHRYLISEGVANGAFLHSGAVLVGYAYVSAEGHIGPLAVVDPTVLGPAFATALTLAAQTESSRVSAFVPGTCHSALSGAIEHGMRITFPMLFMSTRDPGPWTLYLPRNPGYM